jgi:hypothetical protein
MAQLPKFSNSRGLVQYSPTTTVLLEYVYDFNTTLYWQFTTTPQELGLFKVEIDDYNTWIERIRSGRAPECSYKNASDAAGMFNYNPDPSVLIERFTLFNLSNLDDVINDYYLVNDIVEKIKQNQIYQEPKIELVNIITRPWDTSDIFTMGYRLHPITKALAYRI